MTQTVLDALAATIASRRHSDGAQSYTRSLLDGGSEKCARKFGEEAIELIIAALGDDEKAIEGEAADVLYHLLVLLEARGIPLQSVLDVLASRQGISGHAEKAARKSP